MTKTQQVSLINVQRCDLLENLIQSLIGVGDNQDFLLWEIVIEIRDGLHSDVCLACAGRADHQCEARSHTTLNRFYLFHSEGHLIAFGLTKQEWDSVNLKTC